MDRKKNAQKWDERGEDREVGGGRGGGICDILVHPEDQKNKQHEQKYFLQSHPDSIPEFLESAIGTVNLTSATGQNRTPRARPRRRPSPQGRPIRQHYARAGRATQARP